MEQTSNNKFVVPAAIIIAGLIIAGALFYDRKPTSQPTVNPSGQNQAASPAASPADNIQPVNDKDHILGSSDAPITFVLFSDLECSYCKRFHITMQQIMNDYGKTGKVRWVFRHFPLDNHPKARNEAIATECAAELGGNDAFWKYLDRIFEITPSNNGLDPAKLPKIAEYVGLDKIKFAACLASGKFDQKIAESSQDAMKSGAQGTPYGVLIGLNGKKSVIPGALPYSDVKKAIDEMLAGK